MRNIVSHQWRKRLIQDERLSSIFKGSLTGVLARAVVLGVSGMTHLLIRYMGEEDCVSTTLTFLVLMLGPQQWEVRPVLTGRYCVEATAAAAMIVKA